MPIHWEDVRYRGDAQDVRELFEVYRVEDYLRTAEENRRQQDEGIREQLLKQGIRLTERLSPRIYRLYSEVCASLGMDGTAEVFCLPDPTVNAFAHVEIREKEIFSLLGITSGALERLEDPELRFILGHEMGHFLYGNNRLNALINQVEDNPSATVLPALGESLFLRWRKKSEVSADRVGLLAGRDFESCARALLKATFGLSERNLNLDIEALLAQIESIRGKPELMEESFSTHPLLPIRLKALELFSRSEKGGRAGLTVTAEALSDDRLESEVDDLMRLTRRYPHEPLQQAMMQTIALAGALLLGSDEDINDDEVKALIQILHQWYTDEPESVVVTDKARIMAEMPAAIQVVKDKGDEDDKQFILSRLADLALADGALMEPEGAVILEVGAMLGVPPRDAYAIMVGAAQTEGFQRDAKLNRLAQDLRRSLHDGFTPRPGTKTVRARRSRIKT